MDNKEIVYEYITIEFDSPLMNNDTLTYYDVTVEQVKENFKECCDCYKISTESTSPRTVGFREKILEDA